MTSWSIFTQYTFLSWWENSLLEIKPKQTIRYLFSFDNIPSSAIGNSKKWNESIAGACAVHGFILFGVFRSCCDLDVIQRPSRMTFWENKLNT